MDRSEQVSAAIAVPSVIQLRHRSRRVPLMHAEHGECLGGQ
jgi:hypothetical protein